MARRAAADGGKREEILRAAMDYFLEKGYDGTTVRAIMKKAGGEIGLFYYYFKSKDDVFDKVLDLFFAKYQKEFSEIADRACRDPFRALTYFFEYMKVETIRFREQYAANIHRTVRWAIRERTLTIVVPYLRKILGILADLGAELPLDLDVTAVLLAHGVGSIILHEGNEWVERSTVEVQKAVHLIMGLDLDRADLMFPIFPTMGDIPAITELAEKMREQFPGFERTEFEAQLNEKLKNQEVLMIRHHGTAAGCIAFSRRRKAIDFLAVAPDCRRNGVATRLLITAMSEFPPDTVLSVVTYREGDPLGTSAHRFYQKFGFREEMLLTVFGYPCQQFCGSTPACLPEIQRCRKNVGAAGDLN
jgi:AcrR family transcriptional regulator/N-acetylglutamate synthase-like GNAT family acetyltransferase